MGDKPTCKTCVHYEVKLMTSDTSRGECHRFPPSVYLIDRQNGITSTIWPAPRHSTFCGEHKPRLN